MLDKQWFVLCAVIGLVIFLPMLWPHIERKFDQTLLKHASTFVRTTVIAVVIIAVEFILVGLIATIGKWNFIDTFFVSGMLLVCYVWLYPLFRHTKKNLHGVKDRFYMAGEEVKAFHLYFTPFVIGSTGFGMISLLTAWMYYRHYFL
jgi:hypothetical protein